MMLSHDLKILCPFDRAEAMTVKDAAFMSGKSVGCIRLWCERYGIGRKIGGRCYVSRVAYSMHMSGDPEALAAYHRGERTEIVAKYFRRLNIPLPETK